MLNNECPYRKQIKERGFFICTPIGTSMLPLLRERIDTVKLVKIEQPLKKYDVVLYQRPTGKYVLHRIVKVKNKKYDICGDNQLSIEKNVPESWLIAVMEGIYRDDIFVTINNIEYVKYSKKIVKSRCIRKIKHKFERLLSIVRVKK